MRRAASTFTSDSRPVLLAGRSTGADNSNYEVAHIRRPVVTSATIDLYGMPAFRSSQHHVCVATLLLVLKNEIGVTGVLVFL